MEVKDYYKADDYLYRNQHKILVVTEHSSIEDNFTIIIQANTPQEIKIIVVSVRDEQQSFSCVIDSEKYYTIKIEQDLLVSFDIFSLQLKTLLEQVVMNNITLKLRNDGKSNISLGFHTKSQIKELTVLKIPLEVTPSDEIINCYKKKATHYSMVNKNLTQAVAALEKQHAQDLKEYEQNIQIQITNHGKVLKDIRDTYDAKLQEHVEDRRRLILSIENINTANSRLLEELEFYKTMEDKQNKQIVDLHKDISLFKNGLDYYRNKSDTLKIALDNLEVIMVPREQYTKLRNMFSSTVADLLKYQIYLKRVLALNDLEKSENATLRTELSNCLKTIESMKVDHDNIQILQEISSQNVIVSQNIAQVNSKIEELRSKKDHDESYYDERQFDEKALQIIDHI